MIVEDKISEVNNFDNEQKQTIMKFEVMCKSTKQLFNIVFFKNKMYKT